MTNAQILIIKKAVEIKLKRGEEIDTFLSAYTKLTEEERVKIKACFVD